MPSSNGLVSLPFVANHNNSSVVCCLLPGQCANLKSNSDNRRNHCAKLPVKSANMRIHLSVS